MQTGLFHDESIVNQATGRMDSLPRWREAIADAGLESRVIGVIGESSVVARHWRMTASLVLIDGGHANEAGASAQVVCAQRRRGVRIGQHLRAGRGAACA